MKTLVLIDGFNFYHPIDNFYKKTGKNYKWLNYRSLCDELISNDPLSEEKLSLDSIYFFTALARHRGAESVQRHKSYIQALESVGIKVQLGNFKDKDRRCGAKCRKKFIAHEEKETDVRIALKLYEGAVNNHYGACLLFCADSDLLPAIQLVKNDYPDKKIFLITPPSSQGFSTMQKATDGHVGIKAERLARHQFPEEINHKGTLIKSPYN